MASARMAVTCTLLCDTPPTWPLARRESQVRRPAVWRKVTLLARANARLPIVSRVAVFTSSAPLLTRSCNVTQNLCLTLYAAHHSRLQQGLRSSGHQCYDQILQCRPQSSLDSVCHLLFTVATRSTKLHTYLLWPDPATSPAILVRHPSCTTAKKSLELSTSLTGHFCPKGQNNLIHNELTGLQSL